MSVYTVHEPPLRVNDASPDPDGFAFVRDGFSGWAFVLGPLWMLRHRMWIVLAGYVVVSAGLQFLVRAFGASASALFVVGLLISLLVGLEASTLRRFTLSRRGWTNVGVVSGDDLEDAERRFFDAWLHETAAPESAPPATGSNTPPPIPRAPPPTPTPRIPQTPDVIGLFPEPGANR